MQALICQISWRSFYRGEEEGYPCVYSNISDAINFINFNGDYYGYFNGDALEVEGIKHHQIVDYVIFVAKHPHLGSRIVGWYGNATLYRDKQYFDVEQPFFVKANEKDVVLLDEKDRTFPLKIEGAYAWLEVDRRLTNYLRQTKRINYVSHDLNKTVTMPLKNLELTCSFIEKEISEMNYLKALQIVNKAILSFGRLASLIYYKAWILYSFLQYRQASILLFQIKEVPQFKDFACYMLGNIYFETEEYATSIQMFEENKSLNLDQNAYMLAQAYAMTSEVAKAKHAISKAISLNPEEIAYRQFEKSLMEWSHE